jgi:hypothetical protein
MHCFSGDHLLVFDPFGLTRVTLPGKVKHNKKVNGEFLVQNGPLLVGHSNVSKRRFAMTVPELEILPVENWNYNLTYGQAMAVTPAGLPFEVLDNELVIYGMDGKQRSRVKQPKGKLLPRIDFGPQLPAASTHWSASVAMGPDGSFVVFADGRLVGGKLSAGKTAAITEAWSAPAGRPQGQLRLRAGAFGAFVSAFHAAQGKAICALISGGKVVRETVECIAPVDFDGTNIVYQASTTEVCRKPIGGGELERFGLPKSAVGIGQVMGDGDRLLYLTPDHERIQDLVNDEVVVRGLPDAERATRAKLLAFVGKFHAPASAANLDLRLAALRPPAYGEGARPQWRWDEGDQSVLRACVVGNLLDESRADRALSASSYSPPTNLGPVTEASMQRMFDAIDAHRLDLLAGVGMLESALESYWDPRKRGRKKPLFEKRAAQMLLWALVESRGARRQPPLAAKARKWAARPLTAEVLIEKIDPKQRWSRRGFDDCQTAFAWVVLDYLEDRALKVFLDWFIERPSGMVDSNMHIVGKPAAAMLSAFPRTKKPLLDHLKKTAAGKNTKQAEKASSLQSSIDFELG